MTIFNRSYTIARLSDNGVMTVQPEAQARNAALEALVREAYGETCSGVYEDDVYDAMPAAWRERAAKLLEVGE